MLYSLMNGFPQEKPVRVRLPDGSTRTGDISEEDLILAGYTQVNDLPVLTDKTKTVDWNYGTANWTIRDKTAEELAIETSKQWDSVRQTRNSLLSESDWTQLPDVPQGNTKRDYFLRAARIIYRSKLRSITSQSDPFNIVWPEPPTLENAEDLLEADNARLKAAYLAEHPDAEVPAT